MEGEPRFKVGDHISYYDSYWGRRTGIVVEVCGVVRNIDEPCTQNYGYRYRDDVTETVQFASEKRMKMCRKPNK